MDKRTYLHWSSRVKYVVAEQCTTKRRSGWCINCDWNVQVRQKGEKSEFYNCTVGAHYLYYKCYYVSTR